MMLIRSFFRRITKDLKHKELLPLKLIFFVQASTLFVLYPYLTIHMRELGINVEETAIMSAITPFVAIVMPPVAGLVADRIGNFKVLLSFFSSLGGGAALLLLLVPVGRVTVKYPSMAELDFRCESRAILRISGINHPCEHQTVKNVISTNFQSCGIICALQNQSNAQKILSAHSYTVKVIESGKNYALQYHRPLEDFAQQPMTENEIKEYRQLRNNEFYKTSIRQLENSIFFPTSQLYKFSCDTSNTTDNVTCNFSNFSLPIQSEDQNSDFETFKSNFRLSPAVNEQEGEYIVEEIEVSDGKMSPVTCENSSEALENVSVTIGSHEEGLTLVGCTQSCILTVAREDVCENMDTIIEYNIQTTFWLYLSIRVFIGIIGGTAFAMFEGAVIAILREQNADYGLQRIYGSIGGMISSPLSGMLIDYASQGKKYTDFRPAFYLYAALKMASGVLMLAINLEFKSPAQNVMGDVITVLKNIEISALMFACFMLGSAWGYIEFFLFWLIQDLGGSRSLMGITVTVGGVAGIPLLVLSGPLIDKIGHANVLVVGFVFYAIRLLGYSMIYNPWHCLIFEALESVTSSLSFTAAVTYAAKLSTSTTDSSIQGLLGGLYYGVGKGFGSLVGGFLMKAFGTRPTYQIFSVVSLIVGLVYFMFNWLYLKKRPQVEGNDIVKKAKKPVENGIESAIDLQENGRRTHDKKGLETGVHSSMSGDTKSELRKTAKKPAINRKNGAENPAYEPETCGITLERQVAGQEANENH